MEKTTKKIKKTDLSITILLVVGILAVINFFSYQLFFRADLTDNKVYSISDASKKTVGGLNDVVNIKAYFSSNLPSQLLALKQEVADVLDEYSAYSSGRIRVQFIDPKDDETIKRDLYMKGIPELQFNVYEKDKAQVVNGYLGVEISYKDKFEVIPAITSDTTDLEYQITTAIKKVISDNLATIGYLSSHGTASLESEITAANEVLSQLYVIVPVVLAEENPEISADIKTLVIFGPTETFSEAQQIAINSFMARGGSLLVLLDGVFVDIAQGLVAKKNVTGLENLLGKYGVKVNADLVGDLRSGMISYRQGNFPISVTANYPLWPRITSEGLNSDSNIVSNLHDVVLPWASSIEIDNTKIGSDKVAFLAYTSEKAWAEAENFNTNPSSITPNSAFKKYNLAVSVSGGIKNPYATSDDSYLSGRLAVVGDGDFAKDGFLRGNPDNLTLFQNLVDSLTLDSDLISIRSKAASSRPIKQDLSDSEKTNMRYLNIFGVTAAVLAFGMGRYFMRRRSRFIDEI